MAKHQPSYTKEFKQEAVHLVETSKSVKNLQIMQIKPFRGKDIRQNEKKK